MFLLLACRVQGSLGPAVFIAQSFADEYWPISCPARFDNCPESTYPPSMHGSFRVSNTRSQVGHIESAEQVAQTASVRRCEPRGLIRKAAF